MKTIENVRVDKPDVKQTTPSHVKGVREGNALGSAERTPGLHRVDGRLRADARRSTGIRPEEKNPIDPRMPNLSPA